MKKRNNKNNNPNNKTTWMVMIIIIIFLSFMAFLFVGILSLFMEEEVATGNAAEIAVTGPIVGDNGGNLFGDEIAVSKDIVKLIEKADKDPGVKAILISVNSPGGSAVASAEIAAAIEDANKTTVALIREVGASGGYWVASAADHIVAHELSITGSIGVIASYLEFSGLMDHYNVTYERLVAGERKDMGIPFRKLEEDERDILQVKLDKMHEVFIREVSENRNLDQSIVEEFADGSFYLGSEALELGLVDELGGKDEAKAYLEQVLNTTIAFSELKKPQTFFEKLADVYYQHSFFVGKGIGSMLFKDSFEVRV